MPFEEFCADKYNSIFAEEYNMLLGNRNTRNAQDVAERGAQKKAIKNSFEEALSIYSPEIEAEQLWNKIYLAHLKRKAGITDFTDVDEDIISKVISADQSWKKASGHAFEAFIAEKANAVLNDYDIEIVLQTQLTELIHQGLIENDESDMEWLNNRIHTDVFDLYAIVKAQGSKLVFGCIQSKTSIRDRVTRDREPSQQAMEAKFWSVAVALNGKFLAMPKFQQMVNGGGEDYRENGWHGMYVMSDRYTLDRIYPVNKDLDRFVTDARKAALAWLRARQRFDATWRP